MTLVFALWLPILLSAVIVFIASSILHMLLPYHKGDYRRVQDEDKLLPALRSAGLSRGHYVFPYCTPKEMKSPAMVEKYTQGPVGMITVFPSGPPALPKFLGMWFVYCLLISFFVAYLAAHTIAPGAYYLKVFRIVGTAAFLAYGFGTVSNAIWKGQTLSFTIKEVVDGLIYALLTAGTFGWLWPH
jgi:hypothetical protein